VFAVGSLGSRDVPTRIGNEVVQRVGEALAFELLVAAEFGWKQDSDYANVSMICCAKLASTV
jgi:hypothetical protein